MNANTSSATSVLPTLPNGFFAMSPARQIGSLGWLTSRQIAEILGIKSQISTYIKTIPSSEYKEEFRGSTRYLSLTQEGAKKLITAVERTSKPKVLSPHKENPHKTEERIFWADFCVIYFPKVGFGRLLGFLQRISVRHGNWFGTGKNGDKIQNYIKMEFVDEVTREIRTLISEELQARASRKMRKPEKVLSPGSIDWMGRKFSKL